MRPPGLEPMTGVEPALPEWKSGVLPLHHIGVLPVSPGCPAIRAKRALRLVYSHSHGEPPLQKQFLSGVAPTRAINSERLLTLLVAGFRPPRAGLFRLSLTPILWRDRRHRGFFLFCQCSSPRSHSLRTTFKLCRLHELPQPNRGWFTSAAPHPTRKAHCSALGLVVPLGVEPRYPQS